MPKQKPKLNFILITQTLTVSFLVATGFFLLSDFNKLQEVQTDIFLISKLVLENKNELGQNAEEIKLLQQVNKDSLSKLEADLLIEKEKRISLESSQAKEKTLAQQQISNLKNQIAAEKDTLINIVNQWEPYVVALECNFNNKLTGELLLQSNGSGLLTKRAGGVIAVLTNRHIITAVALEKDDLASYCVVKFPQQGISLISENIAVLEGGFDWGLVTIDFPNVYTKTLLQNPPKLCSKNPTLGDSVVILGYPSIGDQKNVTVTEGIIAGFDEDYFITSAKVEKGNSGGAAVSLENNCYLGTPTFSRTGEIESLARILDVRVLK